MLEEPCILQESTNITVYLTHIVNQQRPMSYIHEVLELTSALVDITDLDLISQFLEQLANLENPDLNVTMRIINELLNLPESTFSRAQGLYNFTDKILVSMDKILERSGFVGELNLSNFKIFSDSILNISAIDFYEESYTKRFGTYTQTLHLDNFHCRLILYDINDKLSNCSNCDSRLIIVFFKSSTLFHKPPGYKIKYVMRFIMPALSDDEVTIKTVFQHENEGVTSCFNYEIGQNKGHWSHSALPVEISGYQFCDFNVLQYHAFIQINITEILERTLSHNGEIECILLEITVYMMEFGSKFVPEDVFVIAKFIEDKALLIAMESSLDGMANLVNEFMNLPAGLLQESEKEYHTSKTMLQCLELISQAYRYTVKIQRSNFYWYIGLPKSRKLTGFGIRINGSRYSVDLLYSRWKPNLDYEIYGDIIIKQSQKNFAFMIHFTNSLFSMSKETSTNIVGILSSDGTETVEVWYPLDTTITANQICHQLVGNAEAFREEPLAENKDEYFMCRLSGISYVTLVYDFINVTSAFHDIINNTTNEDSLIRILEILMKMLRDITALHIFLISQVFANLYYANRAILENSVSILDRLTQVNKQILEESEICFKATQSIIANFNRISSLLNESMKIQKEYTYFSLVLLNDVNRSDLGLIRFQHPDDLAKTFAIDISEVLLHSKKISKVIFTVYLTNVFFSPETDTGYIFNVNLPDCETVLSHSIVLRFPSTFNYSQYHCGYWNESWIYGGEIMSSSCVFFRQGFISLVARDESTINVTDYLRGLFNKSDKEKLQQLQSIVSRFASMFKAEDMELVALILQSIREDLDDLNSTVYVMNSLMKIPRDVLQQAGNQGALNSILTSINEIISRAKPQTIFAANFGVAKCRLCSATSISWTKEDSLSCSDTPDLEDVVATLYVDEHLVDQGIVCEAAITVFKNSELFVEPSGTNTSVILGISFYKKDDFNGGITLAFNKDIFDQDTCSFWRFSKTAGESSAWTSVSRAKINSTKNCFFNTLSYYTLTTSTLSTILDNILVYYNKEKDRLFHTKEALQNYRSEIDEENVCQVANILRHINHVHEDCDVAELAEMLSLIAKSYKSHLSLNSIENGCSWKVLYNTDRLLGTFKANIHLETEDVSFLVSENEADYILSCKETCSITQVQSSDEAIEFVTEGGCDAALLAPATYLNVPKKGRIQIQLFRDAVLFQGGDDLSEGVIVKVDDGIGARGTPYSIYYKDQSRNSNEKQFCGYWECADETGKWAVDSIPKIQSEMKICAVKQSDYFSLVKLVQNTTDELVNIENSTDTFTEKLRKVSKIIEEKCQILHPVDISIISDILGHFVYADKITVTELNRTAKIVNSLMDVPRQVLKLSQRSFSATDKVLYNLDQISLKTNAYSLVPDTYFYSINIDLNQNISGFTIAQKDPNNYIVNYLARGTTIEDVAANSFVSGVLLSKEVLDQLSEMKADQRRMIANIFFKDSLFNDMSRRNVNVSVVNGVLIPGIDGSLKGHVNVFYKMSKFKQIKSCDFWKYLETPQGSWKADVTPTIINSTVVCAYNHITHFAMLINNDDDNFDDPDTDFILSLITTVNCLLSILGLMGIVLTAIVFERWRRNTGNQILLHFSFAISIKMVMLYASSGIYQIVGTKSVWCHITGGILHYAILSESCWMLIIAILQFKRFVEVLGGPPKYILWKACICGWVFPAFPVIFLVATNEDGYTKGHLHLCYPSDLGLYLGVWLPLIIILTINCVIFSFIIYNVCHKKTETREPVNSEKLFQWRLALLLFSMLGLTWLFGFFSLIDGAVFFTYLFCFSATLQGFVMFLFFIVFNKSTRMLYMQSLKMWLYSKGFK
ncbi:unnamed protein product [Callosobruchus maculatus]|uniref:G-protein coupled receptors family 2 profile 2 domain-containing protein n=1 Tax=Callosobruchus maculatus TaxID=64391 RepID=A0A653BQR2_CALMS|nr:unnamed protein product [Callosobruchus maculatus]